MDDLTIIKGIGAATAARLVAAGIASFAALAAADADELAAVPGIGTLETVHAWQAHAATLAQPVTGSSPDTTPSEGGGGGAEPGPAAPPPGDEANTVPVESPGAEHPAGAQVPAGTTPSEEGSEAAGTVSVIVTGPKQGRWRIGRHFGAAPVGPFGVSADELRALEDDPRLVVTKAGE